MAEIWPGPTKVSVASEVSAERRLIIMLQGTEIYTKFSNGVSTAKVFWHHTKSKRGGGLHAGVLKYKDTKC